MAGRRNTKSNIAGFLLSFSRFLTNRACRLEKPGQHLSDPCFSIDWSLAEKKESFSSCLPKVATTGSMLEEWLSCLNI